MNRCITLAAAITLGCLTPAFAQELPSEGKFSITYTAVNPTPSKRGGLGCLNSFSASISGASAAVRLPSGVAAG